MMIEIYCERFVLIFLNGVKALLIQEFHSQCIKKYFLWPLSTLCDAPSVLARVVFDFECNFEVFYVVVKEFFILADSLCMQDICLALSFF